MSDVPPPAPVQRAENVARGLPPCGTAQPCMSSECPWPNFETAYGLAGGGGPGVYEYCIACGQIVSKTLDQTETSDAEP